jgi:hypothetical protein
VAVKVSELRIDEAGQAVAFVAGLGGAVDVGTVIPALSLIARDGEQIIGAILSSTHAPSRHRLDLTLANESADLALAQRLLSKAMMKLQSKGMKVFEIVCHGGAASLSLGVDRHWIAPDPCPDYAIDDRTPDEGGAPNSEAA